MSEPGVGQEQASVASPTALSDEAPSFQQQAISSSFEPYKSMRATSRREGSATSPSPSCLHLPDPGACIACRARSELDTELWAQRIHTEREYTSRLSSLAESASLLDEALRLRVDEDPGQQGAADIQGALKHAIEDVTGALSRERLQSSALQAELRNAVEAYQNVLPDANGTEAHALQEEVSTLRQTVDQQRRDLHRAMQELQAERDAFHSELHRITMHFTEERWQMVARMREQAAELALLREQLLAQGVISQRSHSLR